MTEQAIKIRRSSNLIKGFMILVIIMQTIQYFQTHVMDFGELAGAAGVLSLLRGLLLSPSLLASPIRQWFKSNNTLNKDSKKYFVLACVLIVVSSF